MATVHTLTTDDVRFEIDDGIAILTITRPERGNSLLPRMSKTFRDMWAEVRSNRDIRVAIVTGAGDRHFCAGGDASALKAGGDDGLVNGPLDQTILFTSHQNRVWKPVICAVNGLVVGGGLHFVVDSDIIVACESATFSDGHVNAGQVGAIENIGLAKRLPLGTALRMTLQGRSFKLSAERAYALGLVDELVATVQDVLPAAKAIAREIAANSPQAIALSKEAIWKSLETGYTPAMEYGWSLLRMHWSHPDFAEGPAAFAEKRTPQWDPDPRARR